MKPGIGRGMDVSVTCVQCSLCKLRRKHWYRGGGSFQGGVLPGYEQAYLSHITYYILCINRKESPKSLCRTQATMRPHRLNPENSKKQKICARSRQGPAPGPSRRSARPGRPQHRPPHLVAALGFWATTYRPVKLWGMFTISFPRTYD